MQMVVAEVVAHWVIDVLPESCAPMIEETVTYSADALADIASAAQRASHLINNIVNGTRIVEPGGTRDASSSTYWALCMCCVRVGTRGVQKVRGPTMKEHR